MSSPAAKRVRLGAIAAAAMVAGALWDGVGLPLGWLMGAALVTGALTLSGVDVRVPRVMSAGGLVVIGMGVGLSLTPSAAVEIGRWAPIMLLAAGLGVFLAALAAPLLERVARLDLATAFFSLLPGGVIEMASVAERHGGDRTIIAALHAVRVGLVVGLTPLALSAWISVEQQAIDPTHELHWSVWAGVCVLSAAGGWAVNKLGAPAGWLLGAVFAAVAISMLGVVEGSVPTEPLVVAQIIVGMALGSRFRREGVRAAPRAAVYAVLILLGVMAVMAGVGLLVSALAGEAPATLVLCFGIGGMAEMVLTAKALGQNAALVAAFQAVRAVVVNLSAPYVWPILARRRAGSNQ